VGSCPRYVGHIAAALVSTPPAMKTKNISKHCQMFPGGQRCPQLRTADLSLIGGLKIFYALVSQATLRRFS
jgi:hypothetical protein